MPVVTFRCDEAELARIKRYADEHDIRGLSLAVRSLIDMGLYTAKKRYHLEAVREDQRLLLYLACESLVLGRMNMDGYKPKDGQEGIRRMASEMYQKLIHNR